MTRHPARRDVLALGVTSALGLAFLPLLRRIARATPGPTAKADRVLIINVLGGIRSSAAFHASAQVPYNPYGRMSGVSTPFALGQLLDDGGDVASYTLGPAWQNQRLPKLAEIASQFSVLGTYSTTRGDHLRARIEEPTGNASGGAPGILTRIAAGLAAAQVTPQAPAFHVAPAAVFGNATGDLTKHVPVSLASFQSVPSASNVRPEWVSGTGNDFVTNEAMRDRFDTAPIGARHSVGKLVSETLGYHRVGARTIGATLALDHFALAAAAKDNAAFGNVQLAGSQPLTNGMLKQLFMLGAPPQCTTFATNLALAVRLLQLGSPAIVVETPNVDFHSGEAVLAPPIYGYLGRAWAALRWLLARIPSGSSMLLDRTLVITMSDFGRDRGGANGFNGGAGTDHGADLACFYLAHAVMGAGVVPNRIVGDVDTNTYNAMASPIRYTPQQLLVTILDALGLDPSNEQWGLPTGGAPVTELWQ